MTVSSRDIAVLSEAHECRRRTIAVAWKAKLCSDIRFGDRDGTALVLLTRVTHSSVLALALVLATATACVGGQVRLRPGSNVALPSTPTVVDKVLDAYECKQRNRDRGRVVGEIERCGLLADSVPRAGATSKQP